MKKYIALILVFALTLGVLLAGCKEIETEGSSADVSIIEELVYITEDATNQSQPEQKHYESTVATPDRVRFYKDGMYGESTSTALNRKIAKHVEKWYSNIETIPYTNSAADYELITDIKCNEMAIELYFDIDDGIQLCGKHNLERKYRLLIPITGEYGYYVFEGTSGGKYSGGQYNLEGSDLEKYFEGIEFTGKAQTWESTVIAPYKVVFYKDGMSAESTDTELNHKIAKHMESWYKGVETLMACCCSVTSEDVKKLKNTETAIELYFDDEIKFYNRNIIPYYVREIFIPLTGEDSYKIFNGSMHAEHWGHTLTYGGNGLEQYFEGIRLKPIVEEKLESTIIAPYRVQLYKNGEMIKEYNNVDINIKIAQQVESWYKNKEEIPEVDMVVTDALIKDIRKKETYVEFIFHSKIEFFGRTMDKDIHTILIPLTGDYAYYVFKGDTNFNYLRKPEVPGGDGLEQFFDLE